MNASNKKEMEQSSSGYAVIVNKKGKVNEW